MSVRPVPQTLSAVSSGSTSEDDRDAALALRLQADPIRATAELHSRFASTVNRLVWRLLGADPDHNDIVQQVFCKILVHGQRLRDPNRLAAWVQSVTVNTVYEELRRRDVRRIFLRERLELRLHSDLVREVETRDLLLQAKALIERLPAKERIVFVLHYVDQRPLPEVAEVCGFSLATAKRRLNSANRRFETWAGKNPDLLNLLAHRKETE